MLSPSELSSLYSIISDEAKTFENIATSFQKTYNKIDQFKVGITIWYLIKENLINLTQRLASFYILYDMYKQEQVPTTPFIPLLLQSLEASKINCEKKLLADLLEFRFVSYKQTIKQYIQDTNSLDDFKLPDLNQYWKMHNTTKEKGATSINDWIRPVIYDKTSQDNKSPETMPYFDLTQLTPDEVSFNYFEPNYLTYYPNTNYPFYEDEPMWIIPTLKYDFIWDFTMNPEQETLGNLLNSVLKNKTLTEEQISYILEVIGENPNILKEIHFTPEKLLQLIEKNDELSTGILCKIGKHKSFENFLQVFLDKPWSIGSLKVINKIIQKVEMPSEFISAYLRHIMKNHKQEKKKDNKIRLARLTACFIKNLLDHEHINISMIPSDIEEIFVDRTKDEDIMKLYQLINELKKNKANNE